MYCRVFIYYRWNRRLTSPLTICQRNSSIVANTIAESPLQSKEGRRICTRPKPAKTPGIRPKRLAAPKTAVKEWMGRCSNSDSNRTIKSPMAQTHGSTKSSDQPSQPVPMSQRMLRMGTSATCQPIFCMISRRYYLKNSTVSAPEPL